MLQRLEALPEVLVCGDEWLVGICHGGALSKWEVWGAEQGNMTKHAP